MSKQFGMQKQLAQFKAKRKEQRQQALKKHYALQRERQVQQDLREMRSRGRLPAAGNEIGETLSDMAGIPFREGKIQGGN